MADTRDVIIIGSGPAGHTAAIYTARAGLKPLMFEGFQAGGIPGGQLMITTEVENYPGFPGGITGPELMDHFRKQSLRFGTEIVTRDVTKVDLTTRPFKVWCEGDLFTADTVIVATGASARWLDLPTEEAFKNRGVSACATCDGAFFKNKELVVVGGGDTAMEESLFLTRFGSKVTVVHRRDEFRASKIMAERVLKHPKIQVKWNSTIEAFYGDKSLQGVKLKDVKTGKVEEYPCQGAFIAIGHKPNTELFAGQIDMRDNGYLKTQHGTRTNIEGVFACGDVQDHEYRQAVTAAGSGCMAAIEAERYLAAYRYAKAKA